MAEKKTNGTNRVHKGRTTLAYVVLIILSMYCWSMRQGIISRSRRASRSSRENLWFGI